MTKETYQLIFSNRNEEIQYTQKLMENCATYSGDPQQLVTWLKETGAFIAKEGYPETDHPFIIRHLLLDDALDYYQAHEDIIFNFYDLRKLFLHKQNALTRLRPLSSLDSVVTLTLNSAPPIITPTQLPDPTNTTAGNSSLVDGVSSSHRTNNSGVLPVATIMAFAGPTVPPRWLRCDGSAVSRISYATLFSTIGSLYGDGDHLTTFNVPDMRGRFPLGLDPRRNETVGALAGGSASHTLKIGELPAHAHDQGSFVTEQAGDHVHPLEDPGHNHGGRTDSQPFSSGGWGMFPGGAGSDRGSHSHSISTGTTGICIQPSGAHVHTVKGHSGTVGSNEPFSIMPPSQTVDFIIFAG